MPEMNEDKSLREKALALKKKLADQAERGGYHLNPDEEMTIALCEGLVKNLERYGYMACPCRLAEGDKIKDLDIICPCDYRDPDLREFGACYCALYVSKEVLEGKKEIKAIPERRPSPEQIKELAKKRRTDPQAAGIKVWRCKVCGYLCAREFPPETCPVCYASRERFEAFPFFPPSSGPGKEQQELPRSGDDTQTG